MKRTIMTFGALAALAFPGSALAQDAPAPTPEDRRNASQECRFERGTTDATRAAFAAKFRNFGACVSQRARDERSERDSSKRNAAQTCRALRTSTPTDFGQGKRFRNFGACVSFFAKQNKEQADKQDREQATKRKNAAQQCKEERGETAASREAFAKKYRNFGACVSAKAKAQQDQPAAPQPTQPA